MHPNLDCTVRSAFGMKAQKGDVGVELEIEGKNLPSQEKTPGWVVKPEGSLRNGGLEYVTKQPNSLDLLHKNLCYLNQAFASPCVLELSSRGSTHIHVNVQELTFRELFGFIFLCTMIEPVLLRLCGPKRNGNLFCLPSYETGDLKTMVFQNAYFLKSWGGREPMYSDNWWQRGKYACFNTDPVAFLGSVEGRCFPVTTDPDTIVKWAGWLLAAREMAKSWPDKTYGSLFTQAFDNPQGLLYDILHDCGDLNYLCSPNTPGELVRLGVEVAHEAYWAAQDLFTWEKEKEKTVKKKPQKASLDDFLIQDEAVNVIFDEDDPE